MVKILPLLYLVMKIKLKSLILSMQEKQTKAVQRLIILTINFLEKYLKLKKKNLQYLLTLKMIIILLNS